MAEFAYSAIVGAPLAFDEAIESSDKKKWRVSMDKEIETSSKQDMEVGTATGRSACNKQ